MGLDDIVKISSDYDSTVSEAFHCLEGMIEMLPDEYHRDLITSQILSIKNFLNGSTIIGGKQLEVRAVPYEPPIF